VAGLSEAELVAVFSERAAALGVVVVRVASLAEACAKLPDLLAPYGRSVAADESEWGAALAAAAELPLVPSEVADIGLTHAWRGVAETGTLLVRSDVGRRAALLPRVHLMALALTDLRPGLSEVLAEVSALAEPPRALVAISGPSRTGDIEMTLVTGVHGPEQVVLLLVG
jgi:L-lactate dehydrogenase complex protein LldG